MAEKQLAYRASGNDEFFADDDPLAELARIVGFEPRPAAQAAPAAQRQEPAFDLEDELLREFERYDAPRLSPADDIPVSPEDQPFAGEAQLSHPVEPVRSEPQFAELPQPVAPAKPTVGARDLIDELEMSIAPALQPAPAPQPVPAPQAVAPAPKPAPLPQSAAATVRLPLANFTVAAPTQAKPLAQAPVAPPVVQAQPPIETALDFDLPMMQDLPQPRPAVAQPDAPVARAPEPVQMDAAALSAEIDDLLADVDRYPVPSRGAAPTAKVEPSFDIFGLEPKAPAAPVDAPVAAVTAPVAVPPQREEPKPIALEAEDPFAGQDFEFDLADIEMELAELDFAETNKSAPIPQPAPAPVVAQQPAPIVSRATPVAPPPAAPVVTVAAMTAAAAAPSVMQPPRQEPAPQRPAEPVAVATAPMARKAAPVLDADQALPFDPSEISDTEDRVENFEGSHVPNLPPVEPEEPIVVPPEYDFDIDSEMASLFGTPAKEAAPEPIKPAAAAALGGAAMAASWSKNAAAKPAAVAKQPAEEFDEFERALEEDFRRSYREASNPVENVARMTLNPAAVAGRRPARSFRGMATAAAVIAVLGLGAYGIYGWVRHGSPISTFSGEPRVITADADPVKVAPENPGGTVVPNQDKAVYDRVAGDSTAAPKQKELVSSNEQPVDVVQKTLIPESVSPDDGSDDQVTPTPVGETEDPRLLPNQNGNNANTAANDDSQVPSVSPRKVRTMIVKPDGSLVAREEPAVDNTTTAASPASTPKTPAAKPPVGNQVASADLRPSTAETQASQPAADQADDGDSASAESTPIRVVKTTPVPTSRPAQQPAKAAPAVPAAATNNAAAAHPAPAQPKPQQVASASPAAAQAAPAASASASGAYGVQIASLPSEAEAQKSQANLKVKFASVIGGHPLEIRKADIAGKGTYYRVRVVAGSKDEAADICQRYRAAGGTCLISK
ncbi:MULTISPECIES: SPOR domain-containing protein [unclassified Rhizobium]|uniref:SPOR domain-containing protein n=1 Tax=unclassified Rhizobium TaxID=2613769 RepID=UPI000CDF5409|nr:MULTISPECIES: SPOR domain-containing protein [Rhizobium]AVA21397.1 sporulation related domain-containing protein [Rhizobium sp. NXC24]UWU22500.1 SPOR domain-containing protein [Rhizobium tropici]